MNIIEKMQKDFRDNVKNAEEKRVYEILTQLVISGDLIKYTSNAPITAKEDNGIFAMTHNFDFTYIPYQGKRDMENKLDRTCELLAYICDKYKINHSVEREEMEQGND